MEVAVTAGYIVLLIAVPLLVGTAALVVRNAPDAAPPAWMAAIAALGAWAGCIYIIVEPDARPWLRGLEWACWVMLAVLSAVLWWQCRPPEEHEPTDAERMGNVTPQQLPRINGEYRTVTETPRRSRTIRRKYASQLARDRMNPANTIGGRHVRRN